MSKDFKTQGETLMNLTSTKIEYQVGAVTHSGYLAWNQDIAEPRPGIVVIHEWWGLNDYIKHRADMLAEQGYCALAIDMYGDGLTADNPETAGNLMNGVLQDMQTGTARLRAAVQTIKDQPQVDSNRVAAIGYCFGGAMALHLARIGEPLRAVVSFHGALGSFHQPAAGEVSARILVCHGGDDAMVSADDVTAFKNEMDGAEANYEVIVYPGAQHGFSSPEADQNGAKYGIPVGYDADADSASWNAMLQLFDEVF
jgi:dienelactone hydrolase